MSFPTVFNIETVRGAYYTKSFVWQIDGQPMSWEGYHPVGQVRGIPGGRLIIDLTQDCISIDDQTAVETRGHFVLTLPGDETEKLPTVAVWDLFAVDDNDATKAHPLIEGKVLCEQAVTNV